MVEEFKPLVYNGILYDSYLVSSMGYIMSRRFRRPLTTHLDKGLPIVGIYVNSRSITITVSRAVAETFIPNPNNFRFVIHKNGIKTDNVVSNLEWSNHMNQYVGSKDYKRNKRETSKKSVVNSRQKLKQKSVEYKGGKCIVCGYNKYIGALEFHHLDPSKKDFAIGGKTISWDKLKAELDKCVLVCANCHREIGAGLIDINNYILR